MKKGRDQEKRREWARCWRAANPEKIRAYQRQYHLAHPEQRRASVQKYDQAHVDERKERTLRWTRKIRSWLDSLKREPCVDCGRCFDPVCMDFDHVRGRKSFNAGERPRNYESLLSEIAKCELVCSNCHRLRTKKRREE